MLSFRESTKLIVRVINTIRMCLQNNLVKTFELLRVIIEVNLKRIPFPKSPTCNVIRVYPRIHTLLDTDILPHIKMLCTFVFMHRVLLYTWKHILSTNLSTSNELFSTCVCKLNVTSKKFSVPTCLNRFDFREIAFDRFNHLMESYHKKVDSVAFCRRFHVFLQ